MEDNQKKYVISIPSEDFTGEWTQDMLDQKKDKLIQKYPDARIEEEMDMAADEQYDDNLSYGITLPDGTTERWTGAMMNEKGAKLRKKYPDARISKLAFWSDNQIPQDQQEPQSFDIGNANAQLQQQTGVPAPEAPKAYAPSPMDEAAADEYRAEQQVIQDAQRQAEEEYLASLPDDQREYVELMNSAAGIMERLGTYRDRLDAEDSDKAALRRLRSNDEDALDKVYEGLNNNTYYKRQLARQSEDIETLKDRIAVNAPDILADYPVIKGDPYASRGPEGDEKAANLEAAGRFAEDARKAISAPLRYDDSKGLANYAKGAVSVLSDPDFWTMGITDVQDKAQLRAVLQKVNDAYGSADDIDSKIDQGNLDGILDLDEQYLLQSYLQMQDARSARYHDTSRGYKAGAGSAESAGFMLEMALTSGLGGAVKSGVTKGLGKWLLKGTQKIGTATKAGKIAKATSREAAKLVAGQTGNVLSAAARMPFMPSSYGAIAEQGTVVGDDGQLVSLGEAIKEGTLDNLTEVVTEGMGPATMAAISNTVGAAGLGTLLKKISRTRVGEFARKVANSPAYETMKKMGYDGLGEELLEEFDAAVIDQVRGNPEAIRDFVQTDNLLTTVLSFAPMTIMGGAVSTGQKMYAGNRLEKTAQTLRDKLIDAGYTQSQADYFIDVTRNSTPQEISMVLTPVLNQFAEGNMAGAAAGMPTTGDLFNAVKEYGKAVVRYQTFDGIYQQQEQNQRTEVKNSILDKTGDNFWVEYENGSRPTVETGTLADGTEVYVVSSVDENGMAAAIASDGKKMFVNAAMLPEGTQIRSLDEYLSEQVMSRKLTAEQKRIEEEKAARAQQVREQAQPGSQINLGTAEAPVTGEVIRQVPDGIIVQTENGVSLLSWDEAANAMNIGAAPLTDEQIEQQEVAQMEAADAEKDAAMAETEEEAVDAVEETEAAQQDEVVSEPLPVKADGSVDQTTLWNQSPERWAQWNDEQRQDGGANSLNYISGAIAKEQAKLDEMTAAYNAESDFDTRAAMEQELAESQDRIARLADLQQKYVPAEQTQEEVKAEEVPAAEEAPAAPAAETQPAEMSEEEARANEIRQTLYDLYSDDSLSEAEIEQYVEANVKGSQEDLDKHMKKAPQMGRDMAKYKEAKAAHEAKAEELRKQRDFWREAQTYVTIPEVSEADMEPQNALEFAARELSSRSGIKLQPESFKRHTGYGSEASKFLSVQRSKAKGGMTLEEAGERLMELDRENNTGFFDQNDPNAGLNAILDVIQSSATSGDLGSYIRSAREQAARQEVAAARDAMMAEMGQPAAQEEETPQPETEFVSTLEEDMPEFQKTAIDTARQAVNVNPTEAQKNAGNYRMGHVKIDGFDVSIENPKGSVRKGKDADGNEWENTINNDYGYIRGTQGVDGDHIDVFLSDNPSEGNVYVIDQVNPETGEFDEHKVMYGFNSAEEAQAAYLSNYSPGWKGLGAISEVSKEGFRSWVDSSHRKTKPFSEYKAVRAEAERAAEARARDAEATRQAIEFFTPEQELQRLEAVEQAKEDLDASYQQRLAEVDTRMAAAQSEEERRAATDERSAVLQQYMDEISSEDKATVLTLYNYAEVMRADGCSEQSIREVEDAVNNPLVILGGFMCNGRIYVMTDVADINGARRAYIHERQHMRTRNDNALIDRVLKAIPDRRTLLMFVELLSGTNDYRGYSNEVLADEIISFAMERAYSAEDFVSSLQYSGIYSQELLNIINDIINEQREDSSLSKARRREGLYSHERRRAQGAGRQNGGAQRTGSSEVAQQGSRSAEGSSERTVSKQVTAVPSSEATAPRNGEATLIEDKDGRILAETNGDGGVRFSMRTYREGGREYLENWLASEPDMTQEEKDFILKVLDKQYEIAKSLGEKYPAFGAWSEAEVQKDEDGQALMSVIKSNGDYALNLDFSLICKKRRPLNALLDRMIKDKILDKSILQEGEIAKINAVIQKYGFEVACALCFVDAKRYRTVSVAKTFAGMYNQLVESLIPEGSSLRATEFNYAGYPHIAKLNEAVAAKDDLANANDSELDWSYVDEVLASAKGRGLTTEQKIAKLLKANPRARRLTSSSDFITNKGFEAVKKGNPALLKLYNAKKGTGGPKASFGDVQYLNDILKSKAFNPQKAYAVGGVRIQSFSDYMGHMFFDYMQMMAELAAKKLPAHAYTKEWLFAEIFGMTGLKINLSLVPAVAEGGIAPGLDAEGNYVWAVPYTDAEGNEIQGQTFPPERAFALTQDPRYSANVTPIAVGISDEHIRKLLDDDRIHQVIPYHKSSLSPIVAEMTHIDAFVDYTNVQTDKLESSEENDALTPKQKAKKLSKMHFDFYKSLAETKDTKATAQAYLEHCRQHGIVPKFPQFADHENYYKLLVDFNTYDFVTGEYAPQGPVTMTFPDNVADLVEQDVSENEELTSALQTSVDDMAKEVYSVLGVDGLRKQVTAKRSAEQREQLFEDAKSHYGVTKNFNAAGYMLPDGSLLDFSEANDGGDPNSRSLDHRDIEGVIMDNGVEYDSRWMYIADFMNEGAIRLLPESAGINMIQAPTEEQRNKIFDFIYKYNGEVILEINDERLNSIVYMEYDRRTSPARVFRDIDGYFNEGRVPNDDDLRFQIGRAKGKVENLFTDAVNGRFKGKPVSIGTLTEEGKKYLESISGLTFKDKVDFVLNSSDLIHMYNEHFGANEKDPGSNIPLTIDDIRNIVDVILNPEKVLYLGEDDGKRFAFLAPADSGAYNLIEVYTTKRGNLSSKTFYKTKKGVSHRAMILEKESRHSTSETNGATLSDAKIPILFDIANQEESGVSFQKTGITPEVREEMDRISANAIMDGKFMQAPNGKPTNLTADQWALVRTEGFKRWFGDWELPYKTIDVVRGAMNHGFANFDDARQWAKDNIVRVYGNEETGGKGEIEISNNAVKKYLSGSAVNKSDSKDLHLAVLKVLPSVIRNGVIAETHADYMKDENGERTAESRINPDVTIHRVYGAVRIGDDIYRVKVTIKEHKDANRANTPHSYEATKIELLAGTLVGANGSNPNTNNSISAAKLLNGVEKSYESGKYLLDDHSKVVDENGEPKVVYHGTNLSAANRGVPFWTFYEDQHFGTKQQAEEMARAGWPDAVRKVYEVFLNIRDLKRVKDAPQDWMLTHSEYWEPIFDEAKAEGYDGLIYTNEWEDADNKSDSYVAFDPSQIKSATDNTGEFSSENPDIRFQLNKKDYATRDTASDQGTTEDGLRFQKVTDPAVLERLESEPTIKVYRAMQLIDGKLYPPMSAKVDGKMREPIELGQWEQAEERPDLADEKGYFKLDKGNKATIKARYNPYIHTSLTPLNDQFSSAQTRPELVTVEVEVPESELTSGYKAEKAKDSVGAKEWKAGVIQGKLTGTRTVILSRWDKPVRIVPDSEVADVIVDMFGDAEIVMPSNVVTPSLRIELEKRGVPFIETDNQGKPVNSDIRFSKTGTPTDKVVNDGLRLSQDESARLAGNIFEALPESARESIVEETFRNGFDMKSAIFQMSARLAEKEELTDEEADMAKAIAQQVEDAVIAGGVSMTRPLTTPEALWMLYRHINDSSDIIGAAREAMVADNLGFSAAAAEGKLSDENYIRFQKVRRAYGDSAANMYNADQRYAWGRLRESFQDMNRSVDNLMQAIETSTGKKAEAWENFVMALNRLSSKNLPDKKRFMRDYIKPMWEKVLEISDRFGLDIDQIERYLMLKHGLERNIKLAARDARAFYQAEYNDKIAKIDNDDSLSAADKDAQKITAESELNRHFADIDAGTDAKFLEFRNSDYGGITAMMSDFTDFGTREDYETEELYQAAALAARQPRFDNLEDAEDAARQEVETFENQIGAMKNELWKKINAATKATLKHQYDNNMMSKEQYDHVRKMFDFYVPLRGFADNTAEDMYSYYTSGQQGKFANPLITAKGRKTQAETPLGWIGMMAESAIQMDNKNDAKLRLYYFAVNRPENDLLRVTETWYEWTGEMDAEGRKIFEPVYPTFRGPLDGAAMEAHMDAFNSMMEIQAAAGNAFRGKRGMDLQKSVINIEPRNKPEHVVTVKVAGKDYSIIINGNPRAAQAINGLLNIDQAEDNPLYQGFRSALRLMSGLSTSLNPEFWISNFQRDAMFAFLGTSTKNDAAYTKEFAKNYMKAFKVISMLRKDKKGTLGSSETERLYNEFVENGGVTGYTVLVNNTEYDEMLRKFAKDQRRSRFIKDVNSGFEAIADFGEAIEQVSRFAAYMTARKSGKSVEESVYEAKEVTVNFNRKGSGKAISWDESAQLRDRNGKPLSWAERVFFVGASSLSPVGRSIYMFFNASIQGLRTAVKLAHDHPGKSALWAGFFFTMGMVNAVLHAALDDDDDYMDMPDHEKRNNLLIGRNGVYFKWALPQEVRPFYSMADIFVNHAMGRSPHKNITTELANAFAEMLPVNTVGAEGLEGIAGALMPSYISPFYELIINRNFTGGPIYREMPWVSEEEQKYIPAYEKAYSSTNQLYVDVSKILNNLSGGDYSKAGAININPAAVEHIVEGYGGGLLTTANKMMKTMGVMFGDQEFTFKNTPFLSRLITVNDERYRNSYVTELFDYYKAIAADVKRREKAYKEAKDEVRRRELLDSDEHKILEIYNKYQDQEFKALDKALKLARNEEERRNVMKRQDAARRRMIEEIANL